MDRKKQILNNGFKTTEVIFLIVITCIISLIMGWSISNKSNLQKTTPKTNDKELQEFIDNYNYILENYYKNVDSKKLLDGATEGMVKQLGDQFSTVIPDESTNNFNIRLEGTYEGIGVEIVNDENKNIIIYSVIEDSPAQKAGLKPGDIIIKIDDKDFTNKETTALTSYVQNNKNEKFKLTVKRDNEEKTFELKREKVTLKSINAKLIEKENKKIGYIYVSIFANDTYNQFKKELEKLEKENIDSLIIDVRDNTGGHLTTVSKMLSLFLDNKHIIYQTQTKKQTKKFYSTGTKTKKYKIIVLQNENSASASELLSATLKEEYHATVVGTKSYGKGTVQELITTSSGNEYKFTTKKWLTPKGNWIHKKGVEPDVKIDLSEEYKNNPSEENDNQYNKAIEEAIKER
ncbi:MAG: S41 family peptidase [Bacilli bacterium]